MERIGIVSRRVLASLVAANDNLRIGAGIDNGRPRPALTGEGRPPVVEEKTVAEPLSGTTGRRQLGISRMKSPADEVE